MALAALTIPVAAFAQGFARPELRQGMWEIAQTVRNSQNPGPARTFVSRRCTKPLATLDAWRAVLQPMCKESPIVQSGNVYSSAGACTVMGVERTNGTALKIIGPDAYELREEVAGGGGATITQQTVARRVGNCTSPN